MKTICFTGHRPDKLGGYDWNTKKNQNIIKELRKQIIELINITEDNHIKFICGGALGIDQMAFDTCYDLKYHTLKLNTIKLDLMLAIPFEKQDCKWFNQNDVQRFRQQRKDADEVVLVDMVEGYTFDRVPVGEYHAAKMQIRNQYMVDKSDIVIAVWNGTKGGTGNCVKYAKSKNKEIIVINPDLI